MSNTGYPASRPDFSVITATFNNIAPLRTCVDSVAAQIGAQVEHIIVDGGSTDGTKELLRSRIGLGAWVSECDSGIAEAMNKGIALARGEWLLFLHADDALASPLILSDVLPILVSSDADIVGFPIRYGERPGRVMYPRGANGWLRLKTGLLHQGTFIRRAVFERIGGYDTALRIAMDYDFFLRAWLADMRIVVRHGPVVANMGDKGVSSKLDWPSLSERLGEERRIHERHSRGSLHASGYALYWALYPVYKRLAHARSTNERHP